MVFSLLLFFMGKTGAERRIRTLHFFLMIEVTLNSTSAFAEKIS